jgi:hypothetical protein
MLQEKNLCHPVSAVIQPITLATVLTGSYKYSSLMIICVTKSAQIRRLLRIDSLAADGVHCRYIQDIDGTFIFTDWYKNQTIFCVAAIERLKHIHNHSMKYKKMEVNIILTELVGVGVMV